MLRTQTGRLTRLLVTPALVLSSVTLLGCDPVGSSSSSSPSSASTTDTTSPDGAEATTTETETTTEAEPTTETEPTVEARAAVAATGQVTSYSPGDDGDLQTGVAWPSPRFTDNLDGTVTDHLTGLMWTQDALAASATRTWTEALTFVAGLGAGGHLDWRLPNIHELESLLDYGQAGPALPVDAPFNDLQFSFTDQWGYWTSTPVLDSTGQPSLRLVKSFGTARTLVSSPTAQQHVWACRDSGSAGAIQLPRTGWTMSLEAGDDGDADAGLAWPADRFTDNGDGTVTDELTGLMWTQDADLDGALGWQAALDAVAIGNAELLLGHGDWRLPNARELRSLLDYSRSRAPLPSGHPFSNVFFGLYWTSTSLVVNPTGQAAVVSFDLASDVRSFDSKSLGYRVWRVRGETSTTRTVYPPAEEPPEEPEEPEEPPEEPEEPPEEPEEPPPERTFEARATVDWVPNHKMVDVRYGVAVPAGVELPERVCVLAVTSSEDLNGLGDGNTDCDWQVTGDWTPDGEGTLLLRAERSGRGDGRTYTITVECEWADGSVSQGTVELFLPHDRGKRGK